jgi:hypothetical protein
MSKTEHYFLVRFHKFYDNFHSLEHPNGEWSRFWEYKDYYLVLDEPLTYETAKKEADFLRKYPNDYKDISILAIKVIE